MHRLALLSAVLLASSVAFAEGARTIKDLEYATVDGQSLKLDLYLPGESAADEEPVPLVVWIHGGGWRKGSKERCPVTWLTEHGYAVASISYRLTDKAIFPAQIHDCKAAVRWLRANADRFGYDADQIAVAGSSAGGHLAALLGTSGGVNELEGSVGEHLDHSSRVAAVVDFFGPTDFALRAKTHPARANAPDSGTYGLLGGPADEKTELARAASPVSYVTTDDPPLLIIHGNKDKTVLLIQSERLRDAYQQAGRPVDLHILEGKGHGGADFFKGEPRKQVVAFLDQHLRGTPNSNSARLPRATPESQGISSSAIRAFVEAADAEIDTMHSVMIVRHGHVLAEGWWSPQTPDTPHILWSLSKSFTSTAVGLAIEEGKLALDDKVLSFFPDDAPENPSANLKAMRVRDLLTMSTGHDPVPKWKPEGSWTRAFLADPVPHSPGSVFRYSTQATYMQSAIVQQVVGETILDYLTPRLFAPLGIDKPTWDASPQGISIGGYGLYLRTEEIAKFGQLLLQAGVWNGRELLPAEWVALATSKQVDNDQAPSARNPDWREGYGFQFWRCRHGAYRGDGRDGQFCIILPQQDAVIVMTAQTKNMQRQLDLVWEHLLPAFRDEPLPADEQEVRALQETLSELTIRDER